MPRILIVDDDEAVRKVLRFRLKNSYEIFDTGIPEEALALALQHKPDAILLDLNMPRYSGLEVCQTLGSMSFTQMIPIFIVSGESAGRYKSLCENLGAKDFFQKPVDFEALQGRLAEALNDKKTDRRAEPRVRLKVKLQIRGTAANGEAFETLTVTENVSAHGFYCDCSVPLEKSAIVAVFLAAGGQRLSGKARVVRVERQGASAGCGFRFLEDPADWVLR
jgi:DNA-binding response OmpR family regulator